MCNRCDWESWLMHIDDMLSVGDYDWAEDTLNGIKEWVEENHHITEPQVNAISNIEEGVG